MHEGRIITVEKKRLTETITQNREAHKKEYLEALAGYKVKLTKVLEENLQKLNDCPEDKSFNLKLGLSTPSHHLKDYDRYLEMLEWETEDKIDITESDFRNLVQDEWSWKAGWGATLSFYSDVDDSRPEID